MSMYEGNRTVRPTEAEAEELLDSPIPPSRDEDDQPGMDTTNLPGDNRPPKSAHPLRDGQQTEDR
jgi:hypothetical protein